MKNSLLFGRMSPMAKEAKFNRTTFHVGDKVKVFQKIQEGDKIRNQPFEGIVLGIKGCGENKTFIVRKIATGGVGVERIWPLNSPWIEKIDVLRKAKVRRAKLYHLRSHPKKIKFASEKQDKAKKAKKK